MRMSNIDDANSGYCLESAGFQPRRRQDYFPSLHPSRPTLEHPPPSGYSKRNTGVLSGGKANFDIWNMTPCNLGDKHQA